MGLLYNAQETLPSRNDNPNTGLNLLILLSFCVLNLFLAKTLAHKYKSINIDQKSRKACFTH